LLQVPTGGGKTIIARTIIDHLVHKYDKQVLFVAPKIILMEQTAKVFQNLNAHVIHGSRDYNKKQKVLVSTIQTACKRDINPDVIIIDEVHFGFDGKMREALLQDKPHTRIIGLSATPYDQNGKLLHGFDLILNHYDMKYMIENGYLVNLQSKKLVKIMNLDKVNVTGGDYNLKALSKIMCTNRTVLEIVDTTGEYIYQYKKTIVFAVDIDHSELLAHAYRERGFVAKAVHSNLPKDQAQQRIKAFEKGEIKILVSVAMLTTGFDVPDTDVAVIARPTKSQNLYKQMVGRVLRTAEGKTHALLLDCGNVIDNLGDPLEPIREIQSKENTNTTKKCESCGSDEIGLIHKDDKSFWKCKKCKHLQPIEQGAYECKICKRIYTYNAKFSISNNKLYLDCEDCTYPTLISEYTGQEILIPVEQKQHIKIKTQKSLVQISEEEKGKNSTIDEKEVAEAIIIKRRKEIDKLYKEAEELTIEAKKLLQSAKGWKKYKQYQDKAVAETKQAKKYSKQADECFNEAKRLELLLAKKIVELIPVKKENIIIDVQLPAHEEARYVKLKKKVINIINNIQIFHIKLEKLKTQISNNQNRAVNMFAQGEKMAKLTSEIDKLYQKVKDYEFELAQYDQKRNTLQLQKNKS
jgi:superfamily II DNA or RNA helicase